MPRAELPTPVRDSRIVLGLLAFIDAMTFISVGYPDGGLRLGLSASSLAIGQLIVDGLYGWGLIHSRRWAVELARYRCVVGVGLLVFLWMSLLLMQDLTTAAVALPEMIAAATRDGSIGLMLVVALYFLRIRKQPFLPSLPSTSSPTPGAEDKADSAD